MHQHVVSQVIENMKDWDIRGARMPGVVIKKRKNRMPNLSVGQLLTTAVQFMSKATDPTNFTTMKLNSFGSKRFINNPFSPDSRKIVVKEYAVLAWQDSKIDVGIASREGATFTSIGDTAWLIGGMNFESITPITIYDCNKDSISLVNANYCASFPRFNHTTLKYKDSLYIFGGEDIRSKWLPPRVVYNSLLILNTSII